MYVSNFSQSHHHHTMFKFAITYSITTDQGENSWSIRKTNYQKVASLELTAIDSDNNRTFEEVILCVDIEAAIKCAKRVLADLTQPLKISH